MQVSLDSSAMKKLVSWRFEPSQSLGVTSGLRNEEETCLGDTFSYTEYVQQTASKSVRRPLQTPPRYATHHSFPHSRPGDQRVVTFKVDG